MIRACARVACLKAVTSPDKRVRYCGPLCRRGTPGHSRKRAERDRAFRATRPMDPLVEREALLRVARAMVQVGGAFIRSLGEQVEESRHEREERAS